MRYTPRICWRAFTNRRGAAGHPAFTLIEVMISVLILALGLLGLGAVVPVIVHEQRKSSEATLGVAAANAAEVYLQTRADLDPMLDLTPGATPSGWFNWFDRGPLNGGSNAGVWSRLPSWRPNAPTNYTVAYLWERLEAPANNNLDLSTGDVMLWRHRLFTASPAAEPAMIRVQERLFPNASLQPSGAMSGDRHRPMFVWDFVGRRLPSNAVANAWPSAEPQKIQLAIFVRRIDPRIGVPAGTTVYGAITNGMRVPVAVDSGGRVTNTGLNEVGTTFNAYSAPVIVRAERVQNEADQIRILNANAVQLAQIGQPGQRLVDNLGNIYTVRGVVDQTGGAQVRVDPPVPANVVANLPTAPDYNVLRQVVFTPHIPAAVRLFTISRPAK